MQYPDLTLSWSINTEGVKLLSSSESCRLSAYKCPAGVWTIGWGDTDGVFAGEQITQAEADQRLNRNVARLTAAVSQLCKVQPNENQLAAFVCFAYNVGLGAFAKSTLLAAFNGGKPLAAAKAFSLYDKARVNGVLTVLPGLVKRRSLESALFLTPVATATATVLVSDAAGAIEAPDAPAAEPLPMPQDVAPAPSLLKNPLALAGATSAATGALSGISSAADQAQSAVSNVQTAAQTAHGLLHSVSSAIGVEPWMLVSGALVAVGLFAVLHLRAQRAAGAL